MSDELEVRLARVQEELEVVRRELGEQKAALDAADPAVEKLQAEVDELAKELSARHEAFDELKREVEQLRVEAAQVEGAAQNP